MNRLTAPALSAALLLALLAGCPGPEPAANPTAPDTDLAAVEEICETLHPVDSDTMTAADSAVPEDQPKPEPKPGPEPEHPPEPQPRPKSLPRMWDYGSEKCIPCQTMKGILDPMMVEYQGRVDIRIVNVYEEQSLAQQARVQMIPTQIFYDPDGKELFRHVGVLPRDSIVAKFREFGWE
jgi:thioredoxin 1